MPSTLITGSHSCQLIQILETVLKNTFCDRTCSLCQCQHYPDLRLHVCRISRIRQCLHLCTSQAASLPPLLPHHQILLLHSRCPRAWQMVASRCFGITFYNRHISLGRCCSKHKSTCFNLIRNDGIFCLVKALDATDLDHICTGAADICSHTVQEVGNIYDMGLFGHVFHNRQDRLPWLLPSSR